MSFRNIQGMRALAALMVVSCHIFQNLEPTRTPWTKPFSFVGGVGVDIFFVISGFIIYHVMQRSISSMDIVGRGPAIYAFAMKRFIRIYPLYWIVFGASCLIMAWALPMAPRPEPLFPLLTLMDNLPNARVSVAWTLTFEVYFYAMVALSLTLFARRAMVGMAIWFALVGCASVLGWWVPWAKPLDFLFSPLLLEFLLGIAVAKLVDRGFRRFHGALLVSAVIWMAIGTWFQRPSLFAMNEAQLGRLVAVSRSFTGHVICLGIPAAILIYGLVVLELRQRWIMPRVLQYLGNASFSIYLWHVVVFRAVAETFARFGWVGVVNSAALTVLMVAIGLGCGLLSFHALERPLLRVLGQRFLGGGVSSHSLDGDSYARPRVAPVP
ncbi:peptidoglycan/LPS O-acetylase OafA/YrhL [Luteibacter sp. OK325]|uniref:acyltransferase family protein n=1 Tax=Luteibacter sp. OK325 TaxID=2135670 RepID=UPI000D3CE7C5|nr:acyltransferase [Luteibacter sp. OK325]PTR32900.1 peptidoglycan/LPS O-acetylase OafA/YrhL [Luteibacter sp. OK325]